MLCNRFPIALMAFAVFGGWLMGDDPKKPDDTKPEPPEVTHTLPQGWKALGLTDEQKKKVYALEDEYAPKINDLKKQIEKLQMEERSKKYAVLSDEQKKRLKEILESKSGIPEEKKPEEKKPEDKKEENKP